METQNNTKTTVFVAPEIVCDGCAGSIKNALGGMTGVSNVDVDVAEKKVKVEYAETVSPEKIVEALDRAGFSVA